MNTRRLLAQLIISCLLLTATSLQAEDPVNIGSRRELLVDGFLMDHMENTTRVLHRPQAREIAMKFDKPWEGNTSGYATVMRDGNLLRMIYRGHRMIWDDDKLRMSHSPVACYAESRDGLTWKKPKLRLVPWRGQGIHKINDPLANNIVWGGSPYSGTFVPFLDSSPDCPPAEKFKAVGGNRNVGLHLFTSPDAIHWKKQDEPIFKQGALDSMNVVFWDTLQQRYVLYFRTVTEEGRSIATSTSTNLRDWSPPVALEYPGSPPQQMYTNQIVPYFRAPHIRVGFPTRYTARTMTPQLQSLEPRKLRADLTAAYARVGSDLSDGLFMTSRDGVRFQRWDEAFLRPGPESGLANSRWMYGDNYQSYGLFETASAMKGHPPELSMFFSEGYWRDAHTRIRRYTIRLDGFVSLRAPFKGGEVLTKPFVFKGNCLRVNYATSAAGSIRCELQDSQGKPLTGFGLNDCTEMIGDSVEHTVRWAAGTDVSSLAGKPVRMRIQMKDADLYAFQFSNAP